MMIKRYCEPLDSFVQKGKVLVIYGPRRVGKTTLLQNYLNVTSLKYKFDSGDNIKIQDILSSQDFTKILDYASGYDLIAIDEAQQIPNIGMGLKILVDQKPDLCIIATGSSSFDLAHQVGEPLTGRKRTITLYPFAQMELLGLYNKYEISERLNEFLIFGVYPEIVTADSKKEKILFLEEIINSYLYKDILSMERIKGSKVINDLVKLLAFQIGKEVALNELAQNLGIDVKTVQRYIDLLKKSFIIFSLHGFSRNLRKEITSKNKYYFYDTGIRNAVISQFNELESRNDTGQLWENFIISERMKKRSYTDFFAGSYFWRTYDQQEIDLVGDYGGHLYAYELKWSTKKKARVPKSWSATYKEASFKLITPENYLDFIA